MTVDFAAVRAVADSVLYEGYLLYPYRRSSPKNRVRWQFGVLAPPQWIEARGGVTDGISGSAEGWWNRTECLLESRPGASVEVCLRFLQLQLRTGGAPSPSHSHPADREPFDEAVPRETRARLAVEEMLEAPVAIPVRYPGGEERADAPEATTVRREPIHARLVASARPVDARSPLYKLTIRVENRVDDLDPGSARPEALRRSLVATHLLVGASPGSFVSLMDPPRWAAPAARGCRNVRTFPVLGDPDGGRHVVLSAPIILYDHPGIAAESPGDLFDATEIDEILSLRTMTLTDTEKAEVRATDQRAAALLDRVEAMPTEVLARLHGAVRSLRPRTPPPGGSRFSGSALQGGDGSGAAAVPGRVVRSGEDMRAGCKVILRPRLRGADAQDMFLTGRRATVQEVLNDVEGTAFLAVTVDDDPRAEIDAGPGRVRHFTAEEVVPVHDAAREQR